MEEVDEGAIPGGLGGNSAFGAGGALLLLPGRINWPEGLPMKTVMGPFLLAMACRT